MNTTHNATTTDRLIWRGTKNGVMSSKSFFKFLTRGATSSGTHNWLIIWKLNCLPKIRVFVWLILHGHLPANAYRQHLGLADSDSCPRCHTSSETILHLLRDCPQSMAICRHLVPPRNWQEFTTSNIPDWILTNVSEHKERVELFLATIWCIWKAQNEEAFQQVLFAPETVLRQSFMLATDMQLKVNHFGCVQRAS